MKNPIENHIVLACALFVSISASHAAEFEYPLYGDAALLYSNSAPYDLTQETYTFSILWSTPAQNNINFLPQSYHSPIVTRGDSTFVLFVDTNHRMKIAQLTNGVFKTEAFIDNTLYQPNEFYTPPASADYHRVKTDDSHHSLSLGIDENGYLHLVGDMHNYPRYSNPMAHLPLVYYNKNIMYWRSDNPLDISSFSFKGDQAGACPPGYGFTYNFFFNDMHGKLHFTARAHQASNNAIRCAPFSRYDAATGAWSIIGGPDPDVPGSAPRTFYDDGREYDASNPDNPYSKTHPHGVFDRDNNMHLVAPLLADPKLHPGTPNFYHFADTIMYAQSSNGTDFAKADGTGITLPATINLTTNRADIAYSTDGYLAVMGNIAVDYQNNPYTVAKHKYPDGSDNESFVIGWNGSTWVNYGNIANDVADFRLVHDPAGVMSYIPDSGDKFYRFWHPSETPRVINLPASWPYIKMIDYEYLKKTGNILGLTKINDELTVVKVEINNRPYAIWATSHGLTGTNTVYGSDPDADGIDNLGEYALGGNPTTNDAAYIMPVHSMGEDVGTNWLNYVYRRRFDAAARNLTYEVLVTDDLASNVWTNTAEEAGSTALDTEFESVTNRVSIDAEAQQFMKLKVGITE